MPHAPSVGCSQSDQQRASADKDNLFEKLLRERKLYLVLDLDHTILHATGSSSGHHDEKTLQSWVSLSPVANSNVAVLTPKIEKGEAIHRFKLGNDEFYIRFRPGIETFLEVLFFETCPIQ